VQQHQAWWQVLQAGCSQQGGVLGEQQRTERTQTPTAKHNTARHLSQHSTVLFRYRSLALRLTQHAM